MLMVFQVILGVIIMSYILLQSQDAGLGFWGGGGETYTTKRGLEKMIFYISFKISFLILSSNSSVKILFGE